MSGVEVDGLHHRYVRERTGRLLQECDDKITEYERDIASLNHQLEDVRRNVESIKHEIAESGTFVANLRENVRARRLKKQIASTQAEIDSYDMDEIAKSRRLFNERWEVEKQKETALQSKVRIFDVDRVTSTDTPWFPKGCTHRRRSVYIERSSARASKRQ